jgi:hypothetical protein
MGTSTLHERNPHGEEHGNAVRLTLGAGLRRTGILVAGRV